MNRQNDSSLFFGGEWSLERWVGILWLDWVISIALHLHCTYNLHRIFEAKSI